MTILGNALLAIAAFIYLAVTIGVYWKPLAPGLPGIVGYLWVSLLSNLVILACLLGVAAVIGSNGGFEWVGSSGGARFWKVFLGLILTMTGVIWVGLVRGDMRVKSDLFRVLVAVFATVLPILLFVGAAILLNDGPRATHMDTAQWSLKTAFYGSVFVIGTAVLMLAKR